MQIGGVETTLLRTIDALRARRDVDICVITYVPVGVPAFQEWFAARPDVKLYPLYPARGLGTRLVHFGPLRVIQHLARDLYRWLFRGRIAAHRFANIDVFIDYYNFSFAREFKYVRVPTVAWAHSSFDALWDAHVLAKAAQYDRFVMLTDKAVDVMRQHYPDIAPRVCRIYNPVGVAAIQSAATYAPVPAVRNWFVAVSRLSADKDIPTLITAFDLFWQQMKKPDVFLILVGDGHLAETCRQMAQGLASRDQIIFAGAMSNPFGYIRGALGHVLSSRGEGMGVVLIEAGALNTLNIAADCPDGSREILQDGAAGLLFAPGDTHALARIMADVWLGRVDAAHMCQKMQEGLGRFDAQKIAKEIVQMIMGLIKSPTA